jgi:hypothetical protein
MDLSLGGLPLIFGGAAARKRLLHDHEDLTVYANCEFFVIID